MQGEEKPSCQGLGLPLPVSVHAGGFLPPDFTGAEGCKHLSQWTQLGKQRERDLTSARPPVAREPQHVTVVHRPQRGHPDSLLEMQPTPTCPPNLHLFLESQEGAGSGWQFEAPVRPHPTQGPCGAPGPTGASAAAGAR